MEQVETLGKGVDQLLVLSGILAQIDLCLGVTGIAVILALVQEEVIGMPSSLASFQPAS